MLLMYIWSITFFLINSSSIIVQVLLNYSHAYFFKPNLQLAELKSYGRNCMDHTNEKQFVIVSV